MLFWCCVIHVFLQKRRLNGCQFLHSCNSSMMGIAVSLFTLRFNAVIYQFIFRAMQCLAALNASTFPAASCRRRITPSFSVRIAAFRVIRTRATWTRPCSACLRSRWSSTQSFIVRTAGTATVTTTIECRGRCAKAS